MSLLGWGEADAARYHEQLDALILPSFSLLFDQTASEQESRLEPAKRSCRSCFAYTHPYLPACIGCGQYLGTEIQVDEPVTTRADIVRDLVRAEVEGAHLLNKSKDQVLEFLVGTWIIYRDQAEKTPEEYVAAKRKITAASHNRSRGLKYEQLLASFTSLEFRYLGGLPAYPSGFDVRVVPRDSDLAFVARGVTIANIPYHAVLGAWAFPDVISMSSTRFGFISGSVAYFPDPTYRGGGLAILASINREHVVVAIGNRPGWLTAKAPFESYLALSVVTATVVMEARARQARIGAPAYAEELGLA